MSPLQDFHQSERRVCLVRDVKGGLLLGHQDRGAAAAASTPGVTVLGPGNMTLPPHLTGSTRNKLTNHIGEALKPTNHIAEEVPMSDRLPGATEPDKEEKDIRKASVETITQLLTQVSDVMMM